MIYPVGEQLLMASIYIPTLVNVSKYGQALTDVVELWLIQEPVLNVGDLKRQVSNWSGRKWRARWVFQALLAYFHHVYRMFHRRSRSSGRKSWRHLAGASTETHHLHLILWGNTILENSLILNYNRGRHPELSATIFQSSVPCLLPHSHAQPSSLPTTFKSHSTRRPCTN